jgi:quinol-cytochrome oxidoreductase complex cytochrome b subunit
MGVTAMLCSIICIFLLPALFKTEHTSLATRPLSRHVFFWFLACCLILGWIGNQPAQYPYTFIGAVSTFLYFSYFFVFGPLSIYIENQNPNLNTIRELLLNHYIFKKPK